MPETCTRRPDSLWPRCQCAPCRRERARIIKLWRAGLHPQIDRHAAVDRVNDWLALGFTRQWIASACGIDARAIDRITDRGALPMPRRAARILRAKISDGTAGFGPSIGIARRLQALTVMGHTLKDMAERTGIPMATLSNARDGSVAYIRAAHWHAIAALYDELAMTRGPSNRGKVRAARRGWVPPLAWDDDAIDDPAAEPDTGQRAYVRSGGEGMPQHVLVETVEDLLDMDAAVASVAVAERLGVTWEAVRRGLSRAGRTDLSDRLTLNNDLRNGHTNGRRSA